ncbi:aldehyde dehydrogenase family protein [Streptomyces sp. DSM 41634]|uniref:aldehyde dehydrogenase family protein n=1 Tax=Streptomyces sp. DSM 41634 TaxID=3448656 RepID=UPI004040289B
MITLALGELIANHTDIPAGVVNVLSGADPEVGAVLTTSPDVDMVTFTGSTPTGRRIMAAASDMANTMPMVPPPESSELVPKVTSPIWPRVCLR